MRTRALASASAAALTLTWALDGRTAGIALDVQSARGTGMASAVTAMIDDSSAIFYNPAGIARGKILDVQAGDTLIVPSFTFKDPLGATTGSSSEVLPPFNVYESGGITDELSVGVGVFSPFGLSLAWPRGWEGSSLITQASFQTFDINPTVAYRVGPFRIGAGLQIVRATVDLQRDLRTPAPVGVELGAATWGAGANVGAQLDVLPNTLSLGVHYRSRVKFNFDGVAHFGDVPVELQTTLHDQRVTTSLTTPDILQMGVAFRPIRDLVLDADVVWYAWSVFHSIDLTFPNDASNMLSSSELKSWNDGVNFHLGGEMAIDRSWRVRAGVLYDPTPSPSNTLAPDVP
ncbi:MAG: outer membrane protein transport protein, partial [Myxococcales bacterium]|nr:outer membrane protein transport protein [Myxococcales bacterium]